LPRPEIGFRLPEDPQHHGTGRLEQNDIITGLDLGADGYIRKTFHINEFTARVRAILRSEVLDYLWGAPRSWWNATWTCISATCAKNSAIAAA